jgi:tRNA dimethylallyltransferase
VNKYNCIIVLGPTASGKTRFACKIAHALNGEVISADSRQVYRHLNIGTGKDLHEFIVNGQKIDHHLIDICEPGEQFYLHQFIEVLENAFNAISLKSKAPIICGGTGLYLDALRKDFSYTKIKEDPGLRAELEDFSKEQLQAILKKFPVELTKHVDLNSKKRLIRAIEIAGFLQKHPGEIKAKEIPYRPCYIGVNVDAEERKKLISERLINRIDAGLIEEVESLLNHGITHERLAFLGLEYKFVSLYLQNKIAKEELIEQLRSAIFQFAKRQMTWFRKMEKEGVKINWMKKDELFEGFKLWESSK